MLKPGNFQNKRKTFGVLINQIEGRYQILLLEGFKEYSNSHDINLLVFSGRSYNSPVPSDEQYNTVYRLADSGKLDGLIIASGIIGNYIQTDELKAICSMFEPLPLVSIAKEIPGIPGVFSENRSAMEELVSHLIDTHGYKWIAFLKGNKSNYEAEERYKGYLKAMERHDLPVPPELIYQGDFSYRSGEEVARNILKNKIPFEALVCANDDMAYAVNRSFSELDINIPKDIALTGFDDISDARMMNPPLTTIHQPIEEQAYKACEILENILNGIVPPKRTIIKPGFVIRESCGCFHLPFQAAGIPFQSNSQDGILEKSRNRKQEVIRFENNIKAIRESITAEILQEVKPPSAYYNTIISSINSLIDSLFLDFKSRKTPAIFLFILNEILIRPAQWPNSIQSWQKILSILRINILGLITDPKLRSFAEDIFQNAQGISAQWGIRREEIRLRTILDYLFELRNIILSIHSEPNPGKWIDSLAENLPRFGLVRVFIVEYREPFTASENDIRLPVDGIIKLAYDENGRKVLPSGGLVFQVNEILPEGLIEKDKRYQLVFMALFIREIQYGYIAMEINGLDEILFDTLREQFSIAMYTSQLFQKRREAEEKMKTAIDALRASESRFRDMALFLPTIILETDPANNVCFLNQSGYDTLILKDSLETHNSLDFIVEEDRARMKTALDSVKETGKAARGEFRIRVKNAVATTMLIHIAPINNESGEFEGFRWNAIDVKPLMISAIYPDPEFYQKYHITRREEEVMLLTLQGKKIKEIAEQLFITESTVKGHMSLIYSKIGANNKVGMIQFLENYQLESLGYQSFVFSLLGNFSGRQK